MNFKVLGRLYDIEIIATGKSIRELRRLNKVYGKARWRKLKGIANIKFTDGSICKAEIHWYEAHGIGKKEFKIKHILD